MPSTSPRWSVSPTASRPSSTPRSGRLPLDAPALDVASRAGDVLAALVEAAREGRDAPKGEAGETLAALVDPDAPVPESGSADFAPRARDFAPLMLEPLTLDPPRARRWEIAFIPRPGFYENGHDPLLYL